MDISAEQNQTPFSVRLTVLSEDLSPDENVQ